MQSYFSCACMACLDQTPKEPITAITQQATQSVTSDRNKHAGCYHKVDDNMIQNSMQQKKDLSVSQQNMAPWFTETTIWQTYCRLP